MRVCCKMKCLRGEKTYPVKQGFIITYCRVEAQKWKCATIHGVFRKADCIG